MKREFTLLIVDDEKSNLDVLCQILAPTYNLLVAKSAPLALELAGEHKPDIILLDVVMPGMSGFEAIVRLKASDDTKDIPVIFITGLTSVEDEEKGLLLGAVDYILKPFSKAIVKARVNTQIKLITQMRVIERLGLIDPLTEISNRRGFDKRFHAEWGRATRENSPISILMIDLDNFKNYNDTYGHSQGDAALRIFAQVALASLLRQIDFVARKGGEEFAILLPNTEVDGAVMVAERLRKNIEKLVLLTDDGDETSITVSIGVNTERPDLEDSSKDFVHKADMALYKAKDLGRNKVVIYGEYE